MKSRFRNLTARTAMLLPAAIACLAAVGCADGPVPEMRSLNPWVREQWADDEKHGPTFYSRLERLEELRAKGPSMPESDRARIGAELAAIYRDERSSPMRIEIVRALASFPTPETMTILQSAMTDADPNVRMVACRTLGVWKTPEAMEALAGAIGTDSDLDVRIAAARALENFKDPAAVQALAIALDDNDPAMQKVAMNSLKHTTGKDYGYSLPTWREYLAGGNPAPPPAPSIASQLQEWLWW